MSLNKSLNRGNIKTEVIEVIADKKREVEQYLENMEKVTKIEGEIKVVDGISSYKTSKIHDKFSNIISNIKKEEDNITADIESRSNKKHKLLTMDKDRLYEEINVIRAKLKYLKHKKEIENTALQFNEKEIKAHETYRDYYFEKMGVLYKDDYILIKLYIAENEKPKNKYSLFAYGKTKFPEEILDLPYSYGLPTRDSDCYCNIKASIKDLPTIEELKEYIKRNKDKILESFLSRYKFVRDEYLATINNYSLSDFKDIFKVKIVSENDAKIVCIVDRREWRLYNDFYYFKAKKIERNPLDHIRVNGKLFRRGCQKELMMITQTGNTTFGSWWSMSIEEHSHRGGIQFTKENYEKILEKAKQFVDRRNKNRRGENVYFRYPKVKWFNDHLIRDIVATTRYI